MKMVARTTENLLSYSTDQELTAPGEIHRRRGHRGRAEHVEQFLWLELGGVLE